MAQPQEPKLNVDDLLGEFDRKLDRLRFQYEQYFLGIEKLEPNQLKKDLFRIQHTLEQENLNSAGVRFRFRSLVQRYNSYKSYWARTVRQIELGTYPRTVARLEREMRKKGLTVSLRGAKSAAQIEAAVIRAASEVKSDHADSAAGGPPPASGAPPRTVAAPAPAASAAPARQAAALPAGMTQADAEALHRGYADARRQCGQSGEVDFATLMSTLTQRADTIRAKYGASEIRFQVGVRDGKPVLQAIPKK